MALATVGRLPYQSPLVFAEPRGDRPTIIVNFVSTLDGVVSYATPEAAGGGEISGFFAPDRYAMGLLRAHADAVMVGAGTVRAAAHERWTPDYIYPDAAADFADLRRTNGLSTQPLTVVLTGSGRLKADHPGLSAPDTPVLLALTGGGGVSSADFAPNVEVGSYADLRALLAELRRRGVELLLCEGGPHLLGQLLALDAVDELFLTLAPQIAGRTAELPRLALVEGTSFTTAEAPWWHLVSVAQVDDHLFLRYRLKHGEDRT